MVVPVKTEDSVVAEIETANEIETAAEAMRSQKHVAECYNSENEKSESHS